MASSSQQPQRTTALILPAVNDPTYQEKRKQTDLREPYKLPKEVLQDTKDEPVYDVAESPLVAFINHGSGGQMGPELLKSLHRALGNAQVYDVIKNSPHAVLRTIWMNLKKMEDDDDPRAAEIKRRMKIVACGGDGTVTWVMKAIKDLDLIPPPAVAIVPLGTGNDLSRTYKWGHTFKSKWIRDTSALYDHLKDMSDGVYKELDCWKIDVTAPGNGFFKDLPDAMKTSDAGTKASGCSWNYLSIGMDAQSAYGFHHLRKSKPGLTSGRLVNQFWYSVYGIRSGWFCCCNRWNTPVNRWIIIKILTAKDEWQTIELKDHIKAVVLVNLQSYAGGRNIWGKAGLSPKEKERGLSDPSLNDGLFEVVGFRSGYHTGLVMTGLAHCIRLGQGKAAKIEARRSDADPAGEMEFMYMQIDGEPWKQLIPTEKEQILTVDVTHNGSSTVLMNKKKIRVRDLDKNREPLPVSSSPRPGPSNSALDQ